MNPESLRTVALTVAQERSLDAVLTSVVNGLAHQPGIALARLWLIGPGDACASCPLRSQCPDQTVCLHLAASDGDATDGQIWRCMDASIRRFPLNVQKIGRIGATGEPILLEDISRQEDSLFQTEWTESEGVTSFAGQPLVFRGEVLGVLAVFSRARLGDVEFAWLRAFADQAAVAIANSRAFAEIERLRRRLELENAYLREEVKVALSVGSVVGESSAVDKLKRQVALVAPTDATVLVLGESGTGKELVAREIHERSQRRTRPLIKVNCGSIPRDLFESEFFGHVRGAFTGAIKDRSGRFQLADGATLFLDEVGEIPLELQSKLLRVIQEGEFERVGDDLTRRVHVRIIAATNRDLEQEVDAGRFRSDLFYRLSVFPIEVPPLRERLDDVPALAAHFVELASRRLNVPMPRLARRDLEALQKYDWPGNVRELQNVIERAVILSHGGPLRLDLALPAVASRALPLKASGPIGPFLSEADRLRLERENLLAVLNRTGWRIYGPGGAAELLGIKPTTLASRVKAMGIRKPAASA